jgi:hypothetical protein
VSAPADTVTGMTADEPQPRTASDAEVAATGDGPEVGFFTLDLSYLTQAYLEDALAHGHPLPEGITREDVTGWRETHPDYDPDKPLGGQPLPPGVTASNAPTFAENLRRVFNGGLLEDVPPPTPFDAADLPGGEILSVQVFGGFPDDGEVPRRPAEGDYKDLPVLPASAFNSGEWVKANTPGTAVEEVVDADDPAVRCLGRTGAPVDTFRRCPVHPDGAHACYRGPGHHGLDKTGREGGVVPEVMPDDPTQVPDWATHVCDCGFAWADIVQARRPRRDGEPTSADRFDRQVGLSMFDRPSELPYEPKDDEGRNG